MSQMDDYAFPLIQQDEKGTLKYYDNPREALDKAIQTGDYIKFSSPEEALWFTENYKSVWEK